MYRYLLHIILCPQTFCVCRMLLSSFALNDFALVALVTVSLTAGYIAGWSLSKGEDPIPETKDLEPEPSDDDDDESIPDGDLSAIKAGFTEPCKMVSS